MVLFSFFWITQLVGIGDPRYNYFCDLFLIDMKSLDSGFNSIKKVLMEALLT